MRRFLPFAALLGVAFVLGCQDVGTGVVAADGPGPQFAKKNCKDTNHPPPCGKDDGDPPPPPEDATFTATFTLDVTGVAGPLFGPQGGVSGG